MSAWKPWPETLGELLIGGALGGLMGLAIVYQASDCGLRIADCGLPEGMAAVPGSDAEHFALWAWDEWDLCIADDRGFARHEVSTDGPSRRAYIAETAACWDADVRFASWPCAARKLHREEAKP